MASRKTSDESCRQSSLPNRHLWPSSDDEEKTDSAACCGSSCRHPPTPTDNAVLLSSSSSSDEEKMTSSHSRHPYNRRLRKPRGQQATGYKIHSVYCTLFIAHYCVRIVCCTSFVRGVLPYVYLITTPQFSNRFGRVAS